MDFQKWARDADGLLRPYLLVFLLIVGIALIIPNGWNLREQRLSTFKILSMVVLAAMVFRVNKPLGMLAGWAAVTAPFHQALAENVEFAIVAYGVFYLVVASRKWKVDWIWNAICGLAILTVIWQITQVYGVWQLQEKWQGRGYIGLMGNTNETSAFLAVCLPCFFRRGWKWTIPIPLIGLYLGISIGGIVAATIAGLVYLAINRKKIGFTYATSLLAVIICLFAIYMVHKNPSMTSNLDNRGRYWVEMAPVAAMKPLGWGLGQFKFVMPLLTQYYLINPANRLLVYDKVGDKKAFERAAKLVIPAAQGKPEWKEIYLEAHNEYMEIWFALGFVGLLYVLIVIYDTLRKPGTAIPKYGFLISCLSAIWFFSWQIVPCAIAAGTYMGILHGRTLHEKT